jgi:predicted dehydrogenase
MSGDFNVEQHVHQLDLGAWILKDEYPVRAYGTGGRSWRTGPEYGNIFDHHAVTYEYANGVRLLTNNRQFRASHNNTDIQVIGSKGNAHLSDSKWEITTGKKAWEWQGERKDKYQNEHDELFASIRKGKPINNGDFMSKSTLMGIMGRMATYTGRAIAWDQAMSSTEDLSPPQYDWAVKLPVAPIPIPGAQV